VTVPILVDEFRAAEVLGCAVASLRRRRWAGSPPGFVKIGVSVRYDLRDLVAMIEEGRRTSTSDSSPAVA
jgi:hypothetical protein